MPVRVSVAKGLLSTSVLPPPVIAPPNVLLLELVKFRLPLSVPAPAMPPPATFSAGRRQHRLLPKVNVPA